MPLFPTVLEAGKSKVSLQHIWCVVQTRFLVDKTVLLTVCTCTVEEARHSLRSLIFRTLVVMF